MFYKYVVADKSCEAKKTLSTNQINCTVDRVYSMTSTVSMDNMFWQNLITELSPIN